MTARLTRADVGAHATGTVAGPVLESADGPVVVVRWCGWISPSSG